MIPPILGPKSWKPADAERCPAISCPGSGYRCEKPKGHEAEHFDGAETWYDEKQTG